MKKKLLILFLTLLSFNLLACSGSKDPKPLFVTPETPKTKPSDLISDHKPKSNPTDINGLPTRDTIATSKGDLVITPIYHGSVLLQFGGKAIYVDPWSKGSYENLPKADLILITDIHQDHFDQPAIDGIKTDKTIIIGPKVVAEKATGVTPIANGETKEWEGVGIKAIPMYNLTRGPEPGELFHDKGRGNGYVLTFGDKRVYLSGDTECTPEMQGLKNIDVAFVCMNLPYTMPPLEAATCVKAFRPKVFYPYHYRDSNLEEIKSALSGEKDIELRLRTWY
jgi:L-ascorbate metabolism protein UlaG (beta-lactamase superfamily)